jgi:hypothetical protein
MVSLLPWAVACTDLTTIALHFDGPSAAAWLRVDEGSPFNEEVGLVANRRSGTIVPLDLKSGRLLTDDRNASFLRGGALATGRGRMLQDLQVVTLDGRVHAWAVDLAWGEVLRIPYVVGTAEDGEPEEFTATASEPSFVDGDESGDAPSLGEISLRQGSTTTETWSIEFDGAGWWAKGSRSGVQENRPVAGKGYSSDLSEIRFTIEGAATAGDRFEIVTDSGIQAWTLSGLPVALHRVGMVLYVAVVGQDGAPSRVHGMDADTGAWLGAIELPGGSQPWRMTSAPDGRVFVADAQLPYAWVLRFDETADWNAVRAESIELAAPAVDVAYQAGASLEGAEFERLFVAPVGLGRVDVLDLESATWFDPNPFTPEVEGIALDAPISGLAASIGPVTLQQGMAWGALPQVPTIAVATSDGFLYQLDASTGCYVASARGPHGPNAVLDASSDSAYAALEDQGAASDASLVVDDSSGEQVQVSSCGGLARTETWTVTYDSALIGWEVEGTVSGVQSALARNDARYVSDDGAVSFIIVQGADPATDGDRFTFGVDRGLLSFYATDVDDDGTIEGTDRAWEFPARPLAFQYKAGPTGGGWDPVDRREFVLLPVSNSDLVARVELSRARTKVDWQ